MTTMKRKPVQLDHHHFGVHPDDATFNLDVARKAHADVMRRWDDPDEGDDFKALMLHTIQNMTALEIESHRAEIQHFLDEFGRKQKDVLAKAIVKAYVSTTFEAARQFGKDAEFEREHPRGWGGQFGDKHGHPGHISYAQQHESNASDVRTREQYPAWNVAAHQQMYRQAAHIAATAGANRINGEPGIKPSVVYHVRDEHGEVHTVVPDPGRLPTLKKGSTLIGAPRAMFKGDDLSMGDATFNLMQTLGVSPGASGSIGRGVTIGQDFHREWNNHANQHYGNDTGITYTRIGAGAKALNAIAGNNTKAQVAAAIGTWVGKYGEEAEKIIGPHARKTAYKYRGIERAPRGLPTFDRNKMSKEAYHDRLVARLSTNIPSAGVAALNLASGYTAPSQGYLINDKGDVIAEAHGYGDDHYLPFRLNGLTRMRNGSYIRTRSYGGPTTEDIYATSISGGRGFTVASRQGTYELTFDKDFGLLKRFGDVALGMSKRYGKILDAVAKGNVVAKGEVTNRDYQDWLATGMNDFKDDPDQVQKAYEYAQTQAGLQEGKSGRPLKLDGEGYEYALNALKSQYPYYIDKVTYTRPNESRFIDTDEQGNDVHRPGYMGEDDLGYVKPKHIKTEHAAVGYFDPDIAGETRTAGGERTGHGNIPGHQAFYQNWRFNAYNKESRAGSIATADAEAKRAKAKLEAEAKRQRETAAAMTPGTPGQSPFQQGNQPKNNGAGTGLVGRDDGADAQTKRLHKMANEVLAYHKVHDTKDLNPRQQKVINYANMTPANLQNTLASDGGKKAKERIESEYFALPGRATDTELHNADETDDPGMSEVDANARMEDLKDDLSHPEVANMRDAFSKVAAQLYKLRPDLFPNADPANGWGYYHHVDKTNLFTNTLRGITDPAIKAQMEFKANQLLQDEQELWRLEDKYDVPGEERFSPNKARDKDAPDEEVQEGEKIAAQEHPEELDQEQHAMDMADVLGQILDWHEKNQPAREVDTDDDTQAKIRERAHDEWFRARTNLNALYNAWEHVPEGDAYSNAVKDLHTVLQFPEMKQYLDHTVETTSGKDLSLRDLYNATVTPTTSMRAPHRAPRSKRQQERREQYGKAAKQFTLTKRGAKYVVNAA